jgi:GTPase SAR1 family protein
MTEPTIKISVEQKDYDGEDVEWCGTVFTAEDIRKGTSKIICPTPLNKETNELFEKIARDLEKSIDDAVLEPVLIQCTCGDTFKNNHAQVNGCRHLPGCPMYQPKGW